jgi:hypothetical protein
MYVFLAASLRPLGVPADLKSVDMSVFYSLRAILRAGNHRLTCVFLWHTQPRISRLPR